jgi:hypothetical protein
MVQDKHHPDQGQGPKFKVDIEGKLYDWNRPSITPAEIRQLGGLPADPVMVIDADNNERQLAEDEVVELKPGLGFSKKIRFRRG